MRIGWIGGVKRQEPWLLRMASEAGHQLEMHTGIVSGRGSDSLQSMVERCDLVVIDTSVNSHGGVQLARRLCRRLDRASLVVHGFGPARFRGLLAAIGIRSTREQLQQLFAVSFSGYLGAA